MVKVLAREDKTDPIDLIQNIKDIASHKTYPFSDMSDTERLKEIIDEIEEANIL